MKTFEINILTPKSSKRGSETSNSATVVLSDVRYNAWEPGRAVGDVRRARRRSSLYSLRRIVSGFIRSSGLPRSTIAAIGIDSGWTERRQCGYNSRSCNLRQSWVGLKWKVARIVTPMGASVVRTTGTWPVFLRPTTSAYYPFQFYIAPAQDPCAPVCIRFDLYQLL